MVVLLNENQINTILYQSLLEESLLGKFSALKKWVLTMLAIGSFSTTQVIEQIYKFDIDEYEKQILAQIAIGEDDRLWNEVANDVVVTVYNATARQCNKDFTTTASGFKLDLQNVGEHRIVAVERTFMKEHGLQYGDVIKIVGTYKGLQDGVYQIQDTMNKRFANQHKVDVLVPNNIKYGGTLKDSKARMYILKDKTISKFYKSQMLYSQI